MAKLDEPDTLGSDSPTLDLVPWTVSAVRRINANCIGLTLRSEGGHRLYRGACDVWHVEVSLVVPGSADIVSRPYTPLSSIEDYNNGHLTLVIKVYATGKLT